MRKQMDKIKFVVLMALAIVLYQIPCLVDDYLKYIFMFLAIGIWLLGIRKLKKETLLQKVIIYGFAILWCIVTFILISNKIELFWWISDDFWKYSPIMIFIISKILAYNPVKRKIEENDKYLAIVSSILFILGFIITYKIYYSLEFGILDDNYKLIFGILNTTIFLIQLFNMFNIQIEQKGFTLLSGLISIIIIIIVNLVPMHQINEVTTFQKNVCNIIDHNQLTYKNISEELGTYLSKDAIQQDNMGVMDYQVFQYVNRTYMYVMNSYVENANRSNFKECLENIQEMSIDLLKYVDAGEKAYDNRIIVLSTSILMVIGLCAFVLIDKEKFEQIN